MEPEQFTVAMTEPDEGKPEKKIRKRKKKLHSTLKTQMEFYFSDSNLMKDKFLGKLIAENDGLVPLYVFFHFNRIRSLNCTTSDICKALKKSDVLQVSEDQKYVSRTTPVAVKQNVDQCTLYVEHLPPDVDHDWLKNVFSPFGGIDYISLPRFKKQGAVKGFAFVEFSTPEEAIKACKHFGIVEDEIKNEPEECPELTSPKSKRRRGTSESSDTGRKRIRQSSLSESFTKDNVAPIKTEEVAITALEEECSVPDTEMEKDKKKKKRPRKKKRKQPDEVDQMHTIRVMPKEEWKLWKNKYLSMQKATMSQIKLSLSGVDVPMSCKENKMPRKAEGMNDLQPFSNKLETKTRNCDRPMKFTEGVIVRLKMKEPISNTSDLKAQLRKLGNVAYVEAVEGEKKVYIRLSSTDDAQRILASEELPGKANLLVGEEESLYWEKLQSDRCNKLKFQPKRRRATTQT